MGLTSSAMTGRNMIMVAVLLANSVKHATKPVISITAAAGGTSAKGWRWPPSQAASPDSCQTPQDGGQGSKIKLQHNPNKTEPSRAVAGRKDTMTIGSFGCKDLYFYFMFGLNGSAMTKQQRELAVPVLLMCRRHVWSGR